MKANLTFDLSDQDDIYEFDKCNKASAMTSVLFELLYNSKKKIEYLLDQQKDIDKYDALDIVYDEINKLINEHNLILSE